MCERDANVFVTILPVDVSAISAALAEFFMRIQLTLSVIFKSRGIYHYATTSPYTPCITQRV